MTISPKNVGFRYNGFGNQQNMVTKTQCAHEHTKANQRKISFYTVFIQLMYLSWCWITENIELNMTYLK